MFSSLFSKKLLPIITLMLLGGLVTTIVATQTVDVQELDYDGGNLGLDEEAYYEYVAPRLNMIVSEVNATVEMVETKSRDIIRLTRAGNTIETLTAEIRAYGEENGVPPRFAEVHARMLDASDTVNFTFGEARHALRTFQFSGMRDLVVNFKQAATEFNECKAELDELTGLNG